MGGQRIGHFFGQFIKVHRPVNIGMPIASAGLVIASASCDSVYVSMAHTNHMC